MICFHPPYRTRDGTLFSSPPKSVSHGLEIKKPWESPLHGPVVKNLSSFRDAVAGKMKKEKKAFFGEEEH